MRRAMVEGVLIFTAGQLIALIPAFFWPFWIFPLVLVLRTATLYVASGLGGDAREVDPARKDEPSLLAAGAHLAAWCILADAGIALILGEIDAPWWVGWPT